MKKIKYDLIGAYKAGISEHPQKDVERLGIKVLSYEPAPIADCVMMEVENIPDSLPSYIELSYHNLWRIDVGLPKEPPSFMAEVTGRLYFQLNKQLDDLLIEGLRRKGFEFKDRMELVAFIKSNCRCEDRTGIKQRTYFVKDIPFFLHYYETDLTSNTTDKEVKILASFGRYDFL